MHGWLLDAAAENPDVDVLVTDTLSATMDGSSGLDSFADIPGMKFVRLTAAPQNLPSVQSIGAWRPGSPLEVVLLRGGGMRIIVVDPFVPVKTVTTRV